MPKEVAVNVPFDSSEIEEIAVAEFRKRLRQLSPLQGMKEYVRFALEFEVRINLWRSGEIGNGKETLAWDSMTGGSPVDALPEGAVEDAVEVRKSQFVSRDPNEERVARDMPLTIETTDGRGGKVRRKARVK